MSDLARGVRVFESQIESFGNALVGRFGALNVWTGALLASALLLDRALSRRVRASFRVALYAPVALRIALPLDWTLRFESPPQVLIFFAPLARLGAHPDAAPATSHTPTWHALAAALYIGVAALLAARAVYARVRLARALRLAQPISLPSARRLPPVACPVLQHHELGPMAVGLVTPRIVLPRRLLVAGEEHALACVLRHEGAHLARRDAWLSAAMLLLSIAAWPVVPLWIGIARVRQLMELACDEAALERADATERRRYGHALLDIAEWRTLSPAPVVMVGAGELHFGSALRARIEALASQRYWPVALQATALGGATVGLLLACGGAAAAPPIAASGEDTGYGYQFDVDSPKAAAADVDAPSPTLNADGRVAPEAVQKRVRARLGAVQSCYQAGRKRDPKLAGVVTVKAVVGKGGATLSAADDKSTLPDKDVVACIVGEFGKVTYPPGPGVMTLVYPIQLE